MITILAIIITAVFIAAIVGVVAYLIMGTWVAALIAVLAMLITVSITTLIGYVIKLIVERKKPNEFEDAK